MLEQPLFDRKRRNIMQSLLITAMAWAGIGMAQAQVSAPATPAASTCGRKPNSAVSASGVASPVWLKT